MSVVNRKILSTISRFPPDLRGSDGWAGMLVEMSETDGVTNVVGLVD